MFRINGVLPPVIIILFKLSFKPLVQEIQRAISLFDPTTFPESK